MHRPVALTIAGSDSSGGAGIQADLKTMHAFGVFGTSAITALTAQNTVGVQGVHLIPPSFVVAQIRAVMTDLPVQACKTGMLATREIIAAVANAVPEFEIPRLVVDPVMVATSGDRLLDEDAEAALRDSLLPLATVVTPNLHEASILTGSAISDEDGMRVAAARLVEMGAHAALVKGGHLEGDVIVDVLLAGSEVHAWRHPRVRSRAGHGTGCTLSAAIAAALALGDPLVTAVKRALEYVQRALADAPELGAGSGPLDHMIDAD